MQRQPTTPDRCLRVRGILERLYYALGPLSAGILLDVLDLATFGPIGLFAGALVGGYAGWILGELEGFERNTRIAVAVCAAIYMTLPLTEPIAILVLRSKPSNSPRIHPTFLHT